MSLERLGLTFGESFLPKHDNPSRDRCSLETSPVDWNNMILVEVCSFAHHAAFDSLENDHFHVFHVDELQPIGAIPVHKQYHINDFTHPPLIAACERF